jgi:hypothetical protein
VEPLIAEDDDIGDSSPLEKKGGDLRSHSESIQEVQLEEEEE